MKVIKTPSTVTTVTPDGQWTPAQRRRFIIEMSLRRVKPGSGSGYEFLHRRTAMHPWPDLRPILYGIPWAITGAVATRAYMPERATKGLDILVHLQDSDRVLERLKAGGFELVSRLFLGFGFALQGPDGVEVDVILDEYAWLAEALIQPHQDLAGYPILQLPYLVLMKLESSRTQDLGDLSRMLGLAAEKELEQVRAAIKRFAPDAAEDVESLILLGRMEQNPPAKGQTASLCFPWI